MVEKVKKAFTMLFVLVLMMANLPALVSALEQTQDISDALSAKAELQTQEDGNWTALKDQAEVEKGVALKLKVDYTIPAEQLEKAVNQASQLEATIALPDGADFVTDQADNHGTITAPDEKTAIGAYNVATASNGAQVLKLSLKSEEVVKAKVGELKASATLNATLKDPQEKQTLKFDSEKIQFSNTNRTDIQLNVPSAKEETSTTSAAKSTSTTSTTKQSSKTTAENKVAGAPAAGDVSATLDPDIMTIVTPATVYRIDGQGGRVPINSDTELSVGDNVLVELHYYISSDQIGNIKNGSSVDIPLAVGESFSYPKGVDNLMATDPITGEKVVIGTYQVVEVDGKYAIRVTYNDYIENHTEYGQFGSETKPGNMDVNFQVVKVHDGSQKITIDGQDVINTNVTPADHDGSDGRLGPINKYGERVNQTDEISWKLNINYSGLVQEAKTGKTSKTAYNKYTQQDEDAQFKNSMTIDVLPPGIHFDVAGANTEGNRSVNAYMPIFFNNNKNGYIYDGPLAEVIVDMTYKPLSATSLEAAKDEVAGLPVGNYGLYTATAKETATLFGETITVQKGQEVLLMNTGDIGYQADEVPDSDSATGFRDPNTIPLMYYEKDLGDLNKTVEERKTIWDKKVQTAIDAENAKTETNRINFNETQTKVGADHLWSANQPYFNGGYHFDIRTTADDTFDKTAQSKVHNNVIIGYNNKSTKSATYDVDWRKGSSDIDGNLAAGTILIEKKAMSESGTDSDSADLNGIEFVITNTDTGKTYTETTGTFTSSTGENKDGVAKFVNLPSGHYTIKEYNDGQDVTKNIYVWSVSEGKYRQVNQEDPDKDLSFIVNRNTDKGGFAYALYNPRDSVTVKKQWGDGATSPEEGVTIDLIANYERGKEVVGQQKLTKQNGWTYTWKHLLAVGTESSKGKLISYTVQENPVPAGFSSTISEFKEYATTVDVLDGAGKNQKVVISTQYVYTIINTINQKTIAFSVSKSWDDNNNQDGKRPNSINVHLLANGKEIKDGVLGVENGWAYTFSGLEKNDANGKEITYTVKEDKVDNYISTVNGPGTDGKFTITNKYDSQTVNIIGQKTWGSGNVSTIPKSITVTLYADGDKDPIKTITTNSAENWAYDFGNLPKNNDKGEAISYSVKETAIDGFVAEYSQAPLMVSLAAGATDYAGYSVQFYDSDGNKSGDPVALTESSDKKTWTAEISKNVADYTGYTAKLINKEGKEGNEVTVTMGLNIRNKYKMPLPSTGGSGTQKIILIGLSALMISGLYIFWRKRNRKEVA